MRSWAERKRIAPNEQVGDDVTRADGGSQTVAIQLCHPFVT
jgi:hypothetical protein